MYFPGPVRQIYPNYLYSLHLVDQRTYFVPIVLYKNVIKMKEKQMKNKKKKKKGMTHSRI